MSAVNTTVVLVPVVVVIDRDAESIGKAVKQIGKALDEAGLPAWIKDAIETRMPSKTRMTTD